MYIYLYLFRSEINLQSAMDAQKNDCLNMTTLLDVLEKKEVKHVRFEFGDMNGISRCKVVPSRHVQEKSIKGVDIPLGHLGMDTASSIFSEFVFNV